MERYGWWRLSHRRRPQGLPREWWFLERSLGLLREGGLLAMVLPEGVLANRRWRGQRADLLARCQLEAAIGLPRSVFRASRTTVKTCLLFLRRQPPQPGHIARLAELDPTELAHPEALLAPGRRGPPFAEGVPGRCFEWEGFPAPTNSSLNTNEKGTASLPALVLSRTPDRLLEALQARPAPRSVVRRGMLHGREGGPVALELAVRVHGPPFRAATPRVLEVQVHIIAL